MPTIGWRLVAIRASLSQDVMLSEKDNVTMQKLKRARAYRKFWYYLVVIPFGFSIASNLGPILTACGVHKSSLSSVLDASGFVVAGTPSGEPWYLIHAGFHLYMLLVTILIGAAAFAAVAYCFTLQDLAIRAFEEGSITKD